MSRPLISLWEVIIPKHKSVPVSQGSPHTPSTWQQPLVSSPSLVYRPFQLSPCGPKPVSYAPTLTVSSKMLSALTPTYLLLSPRAILLCLAHSLNESNFPSSYNVKATSSRKPSQLESQCVVSCRVVGVEGKLPEHSKPLL